MTTQSPSSVTPASAASAPLLDTRTSRQPPPQPPSPSAAPSPSDAADPAASSAKTPLLKLVVAQSSESLAMTYTLVDPETGRVVAEIPRRAAEARAAQPDYAGGEVVDTRV